MIAVAGDVGSPSPFGRDIVQSALIDGVSRRRH
jgi:hypothetical protein